MNKQNSTLEVWLDDDLGSARLVGTLTHDRGQIRFHYEREWLKDPRAFALDPDLSLDEHPFFPKPELGNFGIFLDSSPDRWGQTLMKRREALQAKWVENEWQAKHWTEAQERRVAVTPVLIDGCKVPTLLRTKKYVDFRDDYTSALELLAKSIAEHYGKKIEG